MLPLLVACGQLLWWQGRSTFEKGSLLEPARPRAIGDRQPQLNLQESQFKKAVWSDMAVVTVVWHTALSCACEAVGLTQLKTGP